MHFSVRKAFIFGITTMFGLGLIVGVGAQAAPTSSSNTKGGEKTVEEAYLQESLETMIIKEQAQAESKDMKLVALQYIKQAIDGGRKNEEIRKSIEFLALETTLVVTRSSGLGKPINDFPDIRAKACEYLGEFPSVESKNSLLKVVLGDREPMVLCAAIRSLGKIGMNDSDDVTQVISYIISRFDILMPDNSLAFESLIALERIAEKNGGIKDPSAIRAIMRIESGNYIKPVRDTAIRLRNKLRIYTVGGATDGTNK